MSLSGTIETCQRTLRMSVDRGRLEEGQNGAFDPGPWHAAAGTIKSPGVIVGNSIRLASGVELGDALG